MLNVIYSEDFLDHDNGKFHPESSKRLLAILETLKTAPWENQLIWHSPTNREVISLITALHDPEYLNLVKNLAENGGGRIDGDTLVSPRSYDVALLAVAAWLDGIDLSLNSGHPSFVLARPPGHHATYNTGMGFCLFANAAIAAHYALKQPNLNRVAILDWDVHHGNGTQDLVQNNPQIAYCSLHQFPCYPGTGRAGDRGKFNNILNIPLNVGSTLAEYQVEFEAQVMPFLRNFAPDLLIISAGYDANFDDPLAGMCLQPSDYGIFTDYCLELKCPLVFGLEGGYHLTALAESVKYTIASCLGHSSYQLPVNS